MKKKELYGFIIRAIGLFFIINQLPQLILIFTKPMAFIDISPNYFVIHRTPFLLFSLGFLFLPVIIIIIVIIYAERIVGIFIRDESEIQITGINLKTAQLILFNLLGIYIIMSSSSALIHQIIALIRDRFIPVDMEKTRNQAYRIIPNLVKLMLGILLIWKVKAIIHFIMKHQHSEEGEL